MAIKILLVLLGIPLLILPLFTDIINNEETDWYKKITFWGKAFYISLILFASTQIYNEIINSKEDGYLKKDRIELQNRIDSLTKIELLNQNTIIRSSDTINRLKTILGSINSQFGFTNKVLSVMGKSNDSMNSKLLQSDRPIVSLDSCYIFRDNSLPNEYLVGFLFRNIGKRAITNFYGKVYIVKDTLYSSESLPLSRSDIFPHGFKCSWTLDFNPDSTSLKKPIYYYFKISYSDLIFKTSYNYDIAARIDPFKKGDYPHEFQICPDWEVLEIKEIANHK